MPPMIVQRGMDFIESGTGRKFTSGPAAGAFMVPARPWSRDALSAPTA